jgi:hypothetical protein
MIGVSAGITTILITHLKLCDVNNLGETLSLSPVKGE